MKSVENLALSYRFPACRKFTKCNRQQLSLGVCGSCGDRSGMVTKAMGCPVTTEKNVLKTNNILKLPCSASTCGLTKN